MPPLVEPIEGPELDRLITALLNATGVVHRVIDAERASGQHHPIADIEGLAIIDRSAARLRSMLVLFEEHHSDDELAFVTEFLALATLIVAEQGGWDDVFYPDVPPGIDSPAPLD